MLTSLNRLIGMPVVWEDKRLGYVERGVTDDAVHRLRGVVIRKGIGAARWIPAQAMKLVGTRCVLLQSGPHPMPEEKRTQLGQVRLTTGERLGQVTDGWLNGLTFRVLALEVSPGPLYRLLGKCAYAAEYRVIRTGANSGEVVVPKLQTWAEVQRSIGEEGGEWAL